MSRQHSAESLDYPDKEVNRNPSVLLKHANKCHTAMLIPEQWVKQEKHNSLPAAGCTNKGRHTAQKQVRCRGLVCICMTLRQTVWSGRTSSFIVFVPMVRLYAFRTLSFGIWSSGKKSLSTLCWRTNTLKLPETTFFLLLRFTRDPFDWQL